MAVATEEALARPEEPLALSTRMAMAVGAALFVCGTAAAIWRAVGRLLPWRWILAAGSIALSAMLPAAPWVVLAATLAMLATVVGIERLRFG
jgi:hypothetical protein